LNGFQIGIGVPILFSGNIEIKAVQPVELQKTK
jgi:hypothetical protein